MSSVVRFLNQPEYRLHSIDSCLSPACGVFMLGWYIKKIGARWGILRLCRDAVGVFCSPNRLGQERDQVKTLFFISDRLYRFLPVREQHKYLTLYFS